MAGTLTVNPVALTITADNQSKAYGATLPTLTASYSGFVNGDTARQPDYRADAQHHGHGGQPRLGQPYTITATGAARCGLHISYVAGTLTVTPVASDHHGRQPDEGIRRALADADGQLRRLCQRRHGGEPDHTADAQHDGDGGQPRVGGYAITAKGAADSRLHYQLRRRYADGDAGRVDHHGQQRDARCTARRCRP